MARVEESEAHVVERPEIAPHVVGRWERRRLDEDGRPLPQRVELGCDRCGAVHLVVCETGQVRRHLLNWAVVHLHRDAFGPRKAG